MQLPPATLWGKAGAGPGLAPKSSLPVVSALSASTNSERKAGGPSGQPPSTSQGGGGHEEDEEQQAIRHQQEPEGWGLLDGVGYAHRWDVPWGAGTTVGGMALWFATFVAVAMVTMPGLTTLLGLDAAHMGPPARASFTLAGQVAETLVGLSIVRLVTVKALEQRGPPASPADQLFNYSIKAPFTAPYGWGTWAFGGMLLAPLVVGATAALVSAVGYDSTVGGKGTVDGVAGMIDVDLPTYLSLLAVTGLLAPILEETVFRGFLLPSLTKYLPTWAAILISSLAFGVAHLSLRDLPVLVALGCLLGVSYVRSRNLLTPIIIHGAWNSTVLTLLFGLAASGIDIETALREMR